MIGRTPPAVNLLAGAFGALAGCAAEPSATAAAAASRVTFDSPPSAVELTAQLGPTEHGITGNGPGTLPAARIGELPDEAIGRRSSLDDEGSIMLKLTSPLFNVVYAEDGGEAIDAALADFSQRKIDTYGAGLLTSIQLFGDPFHASICEAPELQASLDDADGNPWDAVLQVPQYIPFIGDPVVLTSSISVACESGIADAAGSVDAAVAAGACSENEQHQFLEAGGDCQSCVLGSGGDYSACLEAGSCVEEAPQVTWVTENGEKAWYQLVEATAWACRPDWLALVYLLAHVPADGTLPPSYDHADWNYYCFPIYDPESGVPQYSCDAGDGPERGHTLGEGLVGRTISMTDADGNVAFSRREYFTPQVELKSGARLRWMWANSSNIGRLSKPVTVPDSNGDGVSGPGDDGWGYAADSWGINPHALRPGGTDPTSLDDTYARDWLAMLSLKTATTMDGISISTANATRCLKWEGVDAAGHDRCLDAGPPLDGWLNDALHYGAVREDGQIYSYAVPITTIGSTGLPDPSVPGGIVPLIAGSERLAEPEWDDCVWPHSFVTDSIAFPDTPWDYAGPRSLVGDTYRFGKDRDLDLRMVLNTNIARHYCPVDE